MNSIILAALICLALAFTGFLLYSGIDIDEESEDQDHEYPYIGLIPITDHFGFTYEKHDGKWTHIVWLILNNKQTYMMALREKRSDAIERCKHYEYIFYQKEENHKE